MKTRRPHFFDVFSSDSSSESLRIPAGFVRHLEGRTSGLVLLTGPSGNIWHADLIRQDDGLFFGWGWSAFVSDHLIQCGDLLVFRYDGNLRFTVQVFDSTACEKEAAFQSKCSQDASDLDKIVGHKRDREGEAVSTSKGSEFVLKRIRGSSSGMDISGKEICLFEACQDANSREENSDAVFQKRTEKEEDLSLHDCSSISTLSEYEEKKVAQSFTSCFPFFVRIMKRFNVSGSYTLNIPYQFAMEHLPKCNTEIVLRNMKGASWTVNSVATTRVHTSHTFCGGWLAFVRSNEIKFGDVCIFELVRKCELRVHILRVGKEDTDGQSKVVGSAVNPHKTFQDLSKKVKKNSSKVRSKSMKMIQMCDKKGSKMLDKRKYEAAAKKSASVALCAMSRNGNEKQEAAVGGLRMMLALDEEKAARSFVSGFPNFVRIMRKFNISGSYTLKIPYKFSMAYLPHCKTEISLRNSQGECWIVNSVPDSKGRTVHTFCGGWMAFVRDNDIKMGDICIFELTSKSEMRVHISGVGRKGLDLQHSAL